MTFSDHHLHVGGNSECAVVVLCVCVYVSVQLSIIATEALWHLKASNERVGQNCNKICENSLYSLSFEKNVTV